MIIKNTFFSPSGDEYLFGNTAVCSGKHSYQQG